MKFEELQMIRESCRVYSDKKVSREDLTHLVDVARFSPSGCNSQPWKFIIIDEEDARQKVIDSFQDENINGCPWGDKVPAFIVICEEKAKLMPGVAEHYGSQHFAQMDIGMASMALCYEATAMGLGTCMIGSMNQERIKKSLGIPSDVVVRLIITVGYPKVKTEPRKKIRKDFDEVVSYNKY